MNKRNKIILIALFFFFAFSLAMGIYFFPDDEPLVVDRRGATAEKPHTAPAPKSAADKDLTDASSSPVSPVSNVSQPPPPSTGTASADPYISYPEPLIELLGIDMAELIEGQDEFKNTIIHVGWMDRINEILKNLDPEKKAAIIKNHSALLFIKNKLDEAYLTGKIDHETFKKALADLMKWHQRTYEAILSPAEYEALFEIAPEKVDDTIDALIDQTPEYSFVLNERIPVEEIKEQVQGYKLEEVNSHFKRMILDRDTIGKQINAGNMTLEQARAALNSSQQAFIAKCKEILTENEINTIFGSVEALETGSTQTEAPKILGDSDEVELGFKIENPDTSIAAVMEKIDKDKIEDIRFFYQQRAAEREELIEKLDTGEISEEVLENVSREMDAAFEENCRSTLTTEEYQLIFGNTGSNETDTPADPEALKALIDQEATQEFDSPADK